MSRITVPQIFDEENVYVEGMTVHAQLDETFEGLIEFKGLVVAATNDLLGTTAVEAGKSYDVDISVDEHFGRTVQMSGSATGALVLVGKDYLNQTITQTVTTAVADTAVSTLKAFKSIHRIDSVSLTGNVTLGSGAAVGLPFAVRDVLYEYSGSSEETPGAVVAPVQTDPATSATGDPRGTYVPATTLNGATDFVIKAAFMPQATGGLYGVRGA